MTRRALCVGINRYPNAPLSGCVNDANDWSQALTARGYLTTRMLDGAATKANITGALRDLVAMSRFGDRLVFTYSGHGTWLPDRDGDEPDRRDEALCAIDYEDGGLIVDDELAAIFAQRRYGVRVTIVSDSCHSGTVARFVEQSGIRFVNPLSFLTGDDYEAALTATHGRAVTAPRAAAGSILMAGCDDLEYSYDAFIDGRWNGAFTRAALNTLPPGATSYHAWMASILATIDRKRYPQTPQLYASRWQRYLPF